MTVTTDITSNTEIEDRTSNAPGPISTTFMKLLTSFDIFLRKLLHHEATSPVETLPDTQAVLATQERLIEASFDVLLSYPETGADRQLLRLAHLLIKLFEMKDHRTQQILFAQTVKHRDIFTMTGFSNPSGHLDEMLFAFFDKFDALSASRAFGGAGLEYPQSTSFPELIPA